MLLCCFIIWVNLEKFAELVPQTGLAYSTAIVEMKLIHYIAASIALSHMHVNLPGRRRYYFAGIQVVRRGEKSSPHARICRGYIAVLSNNELLCVLRGDDLSTFNTFLKIY
jgi:hypothetical protein